MPVFDPDARPGPERYSVSFLEGMATCALRARVRRERDINGDSVFSIFGSIAHDVFAACSFAAQLNGASGIGPDEAQVIAERVMRHPEEAKPLSPHAYHRVVVMARLWAQDRTFPVSGELWDIEHPFRVPLCDPETGDEYVISGRIDERIIDGELAVCTDWKTGPRLPTQKEVEEDHHQLPIYAWATFMEEPDVVAFEGTEYYTAYGVGRSVYLTRDDLPDIEGWILATARRVAQGYHDEEAVLADLGRALKKGDLARSPDVIKALGKAHTPVAGPQCKTCPAQLHCPIPDWVRPDRRVDDGDDAAMQIQAATVEQARAEGRMKAVKLWLEGTEQQVVVVGGKATGFHQVKKRSLNKQRLAEALDGGNVTPDSLYDTTTTVEFKTKNA